MTAFRQAGYDDLTQFAQMRWDFRTEEEHQPPLMSREEFVRECVAFLRQGLEQHSWTYWVAEQDGLLVSHVFVHRILKVPSPFDLSGRFGYVTNVYTRPEHRNQGVGSALLERVLEWARQEDLETLIVWPSEASIPFYKRAGFTSRNDVLELQLHEE